MKINVEIDCTPEEARRAVGLPDFTPVHEKYIATITEAMEGGVTGEMLEPLIRSWAPMGEAGMSLWRAVFDAAAKSRS